MTSSMTSTASVHLWRCTHTLCGRVVEAGEIGYLRHTYRQDEAMEAATRLRHRDDPPKCIGRYVGDGSYSSHRAAPMELVEYVEADRVAP